MSVTVFLAGIFLYIFFRSVRSGQYDDTYTPSVRMLFDDELVKEKKTKKQNNKRVKKNQLNNN